MMLIELWIISLLPRTVSRYSTLTSVSYSVYVKMQKCGKVFLELTRKPFCPSHVIRELIHLQSRSFLKTS